VCIGERGDPCLRADKRVVDGKAGPDSFEQLQITPCSGWAAVEEGTVSRMVSQVRLESRQA